MMDEMVMGRKSPPVVAERDLGMKTVLATLSSSGSVAKANQLVKMIARMDGGILDTSLRVRPSGPGAVFVSVFLRTPRISPSVNGSTSMLSTGSDVMNPSTGLDGVDMRGS